MKIICSGYPKTGTKTLSAALRTLGYTVFDFDEQFFYRGRETIKAMDEGWTTEDIYQMYKDVDAISDQPACILWEEILKAFPEAKIVHTERASDEEWIKSAVKQIESMKAKRLNYMLMMITPTGYRLNCFLYLGFQLVAGGIINNPFFTRLANTDLAKIRYREHNARVREIAPKEQILYFKLSDGWEPLCEFLDKPIPQRPFPHKNKGGAAAAAFFDKSYVAKQINKELRLSFTLIAILVGILIYYFW